MTIAVTPRAARCNGVKGNTYGEGKWYGINDSWLKIHDEMDIPQDYRNLLRVKENRALWILAGLRQSMCIGCGEGK